MPAIGITRRELLATAIAASAAGLAGCLGGDHEVPPPLVQPIENESAWSKFDQTTGVVFEESIGPVTLAAHQHILIFEHIELREDLTDVVGNITTSPVLFFAGRIDLRPGVDRLPFGLGRERIMREVRPAVNQGFREQLISNGLSDIRLIGTDSRTVDSGFDAAEFQYEASFPFDGVIDSPTGDSENISGVMELVARVAVWHDGTDILFAGGTHPRERLDAIVTESLPEMPLEVDIEAPDGALATEPDEFEEEIGLLLDAVQ